MRDLGVPFRSSSVFPSRRIWQPARIQSAFWVPEPHCQTPSTRKPPSTATAFPRGAKTPEIRQLGFAKIPLLPGTGAIYRSQTLEFLRPVHPGDTLTAHLEVESLDPVTNEIALDCRIDRDDGASVLRGQAVVSLIRKLDS